MYIEKSGKVRNEETYYRIDIYRQLYTKHTVHTHRTAELIYFIISNCARE